jgi:hypothetical protein
MKAFLLVIATLFLASAAQAARPDVRAMTCRDAAGLVDEKGAVVFTTGKYTYERVVSSHFRCGSSSKDVGVKTYAKTLDVETCFVGYICRREETAGNGSSIIGASAPYVCPDGKVRWEERRDQFDYKEYVRLQCQSGKWIETGERR